jgi:MbtH protein
MNDTRYTVVINDEEQYSIWEADRPPPAGWHEVGVTGTKDECLAHIDEVWTDMRPRSLRQAMDREAADTPSAPGDRDRER